MSSPVTTALARSPDTQPCDARSFAGPESSSSSPARAGAAGSAIAPSSTGRTSRGRRNIGNLIVRELWTRPRLAAPLGLHNNAWRSLDSQDLSTCTGPLRPAPQTNHGRVIGSDDRTFGSSSLRPAATLQHWAHGQADRR